VNPSTTAFNIETVRDFSFVRHSESNRRPKEECIVGSPGNRPIASACHTGGFFHYVDNSARGHFDGLNPRLVLPNSIFTEHGMKGSLSRLTRLRIFIIYIQIEVRAHYSTSSAGMRMGGRRKVVRRAGLACTRFRRHRVSCFDGTGGESWRDGSLHASSS
jgi:hypothetical protein